MSPSQRAMQGDNDATAEELVELPVGKQPLFSIY